MKLSIRFEFIRDYFIPSLIVFTAQKPSHIIGFFMVTLCLTLLVMEGD